MRTRWKASRSTNSSHARLIVGTVARVTGANILVNIRSRHGVAHQERYRRGDGVRVGGVSRAELVNSDTANPSATSEKQRQMQRIHSLYRAWYRNRDDVEALRQLHDAIDDYLVVSMDGALS